jgi:hypothetical protein
MKGFVQDIEDLAVRNDEFRRVLYTAQHCQLVVILVQNAFNFTRPTAPYVMRSRQRGSCPHRGPGRLRSFPERVGRRSLPPRSNNAVPRTGLGIGLTFSRWALKRTEAGSTRATCLGRDAFLFGTCPGRQFRRPRPRPRQSSPLKTN